MEETLENKVVIKLNDLNIYQDKSLILSNVNLEVNKGEFVYLIGKTGSGKSSLLKTLYGDLQVTEGEANVNDFDLKKIKNKDIPFLRRSLGIVFQDFELLMDRSINENLLFVLKATGWKDEKKMQNRIDTVLFQVGLQTKHFKMPHELSGGEQQRVVIARALLNEPPLILADEPTGNLDPETSEDIMNLIMKINKDLNTAFIMATHNYTLMEKFPSRIINCKDGKIIDDKQISIN